MLNIKELWERQDVIKEIYSTVTGEKVTDSSWRFCKPILIKPTNEKECYYIQITVHDAWYFFIFETGLINNQTPEGIRLTAKMVIELAEILKPFYVEE
jgi:hypothetical protein